MNACGVYNWTKITPCVEYETAEDDCVETDTNPVISAARALHEPTNM